MGNNIQIVTDSTAYITKEYAKKHNIIIVPLSVEFENEVEEEGFPGEFENYFQRLKKSKDFPKTSQPSVGTFVKVFEKAINEGKEVLAILMSSGLSGTYNSACLAANMVDSEKISVIDSRTTIQNLWYLVDRAKELANNNVPRDEIVRVINSEKKNTRAFLTVDKLDYLKKGGRLSGSQARIGNLLKIKPIIEFTNGELLFFDKVRGKKKAIELMISNLPENAKKIYVCHIMNEKEAEKIKARLEKEFVNTIVTIEEIGPVIGSHLGPKMIGFSFVW